MRRCSRWLQKEPPQARVSLSFQGALGIAVPAPGIQPAEEIWGPRQGAVSQQQPLQASPQPSSS